MRINAAVVSPIVLVVGVLGSASTAIGGKQPHVEGDRLEFALPDLEGRIVRSSDSRFHDKVILVDVWATWCPPCLSAAPTFVDLQRRYGDRGLVVVGVSLEGGDDPEDRRAKLRAFADERGLNYLLLDGGAWSDLGKTLPALRGVRGIPVEVLIGRDGRVVETRHGYGYKKRWARKLEEQIVALLDGASDE